MAGEDPMKDIAEYAKRAAKASAESQNGTQQRWHLGLKDEPVEHLVKSAYYASMMADESR